MLKKEANLADWRYFDMITEINDDVSDVFEDIETINGNSFLISYYDSGADATKERFINYCDNLIYKVDERYKQSNKTSLQSIIKFKTLKNIEITKNLIFDKINALKSTQRSKVKLFEILDQKNKKTG
jgi:hypothetical protein